MHNQDAKDHVLTTIRLERDVHKQLRHLAVERRTSITAIIKELTERYVAEAARENAVA